MVSYRSIFIQLVLTVVLISCQMSVAAFEINPDLIDPAQISSEQQEFPKAQAEFSTSSDQIPEPFLPPKLTLQDLMTPQQKQAVSPEAVEDWVVIMDSEYTFSGYAGQDWGEGFYDGDSDTARYSYPQGLDFDKDGNLYVADSLNHTIRKVTPDGTVTTLAGLAGVKGFVNGFGEQARFNQPIDVEVGEDGYIYVADAVNSVIRRVSPDGYAETWAGTTSGKLDGNWNVARFYHPQGLAFDPFGNLLVADSGNDLIRKITKGRQVVTVKFKPQPWDVNYGVIKLNNPIGVVGAPDGSIYVANYGSARILKITNDGWLVHWAGLYKGHRDGPREQALLNLPHHIEMDQAGNLIFTEIGTGPRPWRGVRKISPDGIVSTISGAVSPGYRNGPAGQAMFWKPYGLALDPNDNIYVGDAHNHAIRKITPDGKVDTYSGPKFGSECPFGMVDGPLSSASLCNPTKLTRTQPGDIAFIDDDYQTAQSSVRLILNGDEVITLATTHEVPGLFDPDGNPIVFTPNGGMAASAWGTLIVSDPINHVLWEVDFSGKVSLFAGQPGVRGYTEGNRLDIVLNYPVELAADSLGNIYVGEIFNNIIRKIYPDGKTLLWAGKPGERGHEDGYGDTSRLIDTLGMDFDPIGLLTFGEAYSSTIRQVDGDRLVTTPIGQPFVGDYIDGEKDQVRLLRMRGLSHTKNGELIFTHPVSYNHFPISRTIRRRDEKGYVTTLAGHLFVNGNFDGTGSNALFQFPVDTLPGPQNSIFVSDRENRAIKKGLPAIDAFASIDMTEACMGEQRQLSVAGEEAQTFEWKIIRKPTGSTAVLSDMTIANPTFTPDVPDLFVFRLKASGVDGERISYIWVRATGPVFVSQPVHQTVCLGQTVTMTAMAYQPWTVSYQWYKDGAPLAGETASLLEIPTVDVTHLGSYSCRITNVCGTRETIPAQLMIVDEAPPVIVSNPESQEHCYVEILNLSAEATGATHYNWYENGTLIVGQNQASFSHFGWPFPGTNEYYMEAVNTCHAVPTEIATVTIDMGPELLNPGTQEIHVCYGETLTMTIETNGADYFYWEKDWVSMPNQYTETIEIFIDNAADEAIFAAFAGDDCKERMKRFDVFIDGYPPTITSQTFSQEGCVGGSATFEVQATGADGYQWQKDGVDIAGADQPILQLNSLILADAGSFTCKVSIGLCAPLTTIPAPLTISEGSPAIISQSFSQEVCIGTNLTLFVEAKNAFSYQWYKDGQILGHEKGPELSVFAIPGFGSGKDPNTATFTCKVINNCAEVMSAPMTISLGANSVPQIRTHPFNQQGCLNASAQFRVFMEYSGTFDYQWFHGEQALVDDGRISGANTDVLQVTDLIGQDQGAYWVRISNECGGPVDSNRAGLSITPPPAINGMSQSFLQNSFDWTQETIVLEGTFPTPHPNSNGMLALLEDIHTGQRHPLKLVDYSSDRMEFGFTQAPGLGIHFLGKLIITDFVCTHSKDINGDPILVAVGKQGNLMFGQSLGPATGGTQLNLYAVGNAPLSSFPAEFITSKGTIAAKANITKKPDGTFSVVTPPLLSGHEYSIRVRISNYTHFKTSPDYRFKATTLALVSGTNKVAVVDVDPLATDANAPALALVDLDPYTWGTQSDYTLTFETKTRGPVVQVGTWRSSVTGAPVALGMVGYAAYVDTIDLATFESPQQFTNRIQQDGHFLDVRQHSNLQHLAIVVDVAFGLDSDPLTSEDQQIFVDVQESSDPTCCSTSPVPCLGVINRYTVMSADPFAPGASLVASTQLAGEVMLCSGASINRPSLYSNHIARSGDYLMSGITSHLGNGEFETKILVHDVTKPQQSCKDCAPEYPPVNVVSNGSSFTGRTGSMAMAVIRDRGRVIYLDEGNHSLEQFTINPSTLNISPNAKLSVKVESARSPFGLTWMLVGPGSGTSLLFQAEYNDPDQQNAGMIGVYSIPEESAPVRIGEFTTTPPRGQRMRPIAIAPRWHGEVVSGLESMPYTADPNAWLLALDKSNQSLHAFLPGNGTVLGSLELTGWEDQSPFDLSCMIRRDGASSIALAINVANALPEDSFTSPKQQDSLIQGMTQLGQWIAQPDGKLEQQLGRAGSLVNLAEGSLKEEIPRTLVTSYLGAVIEELEATKNQ